MGWSCAAKASLTLDALAKSLRDRIGSETSNAMRLPDGSEAFWETSRREYGDGAITGTIWRVLADRCRRAGSFKIDGDGKIIRFAGVPKAYRKAAEMAGAAEYSRLYGESFNKSAHQNLQMGGAA